MNLSNNWSDLYTHKTLGIATWQSYFLVEGGGLWFHNENAIVGVNLFMGLCFLQLECKNVKNLPVWTVQNSIKEELPHQFSGVPIDGKETIPQYCKGILGEAAKHVIPCILSLVDFYVVASANSYSWTLVWSKVQSILGSKTVFSSSDARQGLIDQTACLGENNYENGFVNFP